MKKLVIIPAIILGSLICKIADAQNVNPRYNNGYNRMQPVMAQEHNYRNNAPVYEAGYDRYHDQYRDHERFDRDRMDWRDRYDYRDRMDRRFDRERAFREQRYLDRRYDDRARFNRF
jgi:hypothetical protein